MLRATATWIGVLSVCSSCYAQVRDQQLPFRCIDRGDFQAEAIVRVTPPIVRPGGEFKVECELRCIGGYSTVVNACLADEYDLPARIVLASADGKTYLDLLPGESRDTDRGPVLLLRGSQSVGRELVVAVVGDSTKPVAAGNDKRTVHLPPGDYFVQAIYDRRLFAESALRRRLAASDLSVEEVRQAPVPVGPRNSDPVAISKPAMLAVHKDGDSVVVPKSTSPLGIELRPSKMRVTTGRMVEFEIRMVNQSDESIELYDPFLSGLLWRRRSFVLRVADGAGTDLGDLLHRAQGSSRRPDIDSWVSVPAGGTVSSTFNSRAGRVPNKKFNAPLELDPGRYSMELIAYGHTIDGRPKEIEALDEVGYLPVVHQSHGNRRTESLADWEATLPGEEICRSNRVEVEILPRTGE